MGAADELRLSETELAHSDFESVCLAHALHPSHTPSTDCQKFLSTGQLAPLASLFFVCFTSSEL